jgi:hypothetical protein
LRREYPTRAGIITAFVVKAFMIQEDKRKAVNREPIANDTSTKLFTMSHLSLDRCSLGHES